MAVLRTFNWLGQARVDVPHLKILESAVCADFDVGFGQIIAGTRPLIVRGFEIVNSDAMIGQKVSDLQINAGQSILMHYYASQAGSIFYEPEPIIVKLNETDSRFVGSFTANTVNYVGIDLIRTTNTQTQDTVKFLDPVTKKEISRQVPLGNLMDFNIIVSLQDFDSIPSLCPICKVITDSNNNIVLIEDARNSPFRLARGGSYPNIQSAYSWPQGRDENTTGNIFFGGDKALQSYKDWSDAVMTRLWELGGGKYWYSPTADRNVGMTRSGTQFSNGEWFEWDGTNLHWRGLRMVFDNAGTTIWYNIISDQTVNAVGVYGTTATNLVDGDCIYVDIDRTSNATISAIKGITAQLGTPIVPGSRYIIAWRVGTQVFTRGSSFEVGTTFNVATNTSLGLVELTYAAGNPSVPKVAPQDTNGRIHNEATANNAPGLEGTGFGTGAGVQGTGGTSGGSGIKGIGGGFPGSVGVEGIGLGTGFGVTGSGDPAGNGGGVFGQATSGSVAAGVIGVGGSAGGFGGQFTGGTDSAGVFGSATGNGIGIKGSGTGTGAAILAVSSGAVTGPGFSATDLAGNSRFKTDHIGFSGGWYNEIREKGYWSTANWATSISGTASATTNDSLATYNQAVLSVTAGAGSTSNFVGVGSGGGGVEPFSKYRTTTLAYMEFDFCRTGTATLANFDVINGFAEIQGATWIGSTNTDYAWFRIQGGNWLAETKDGVTATSVDTGVAITAADTMQRFRIEYQGSATSGTAATRCLFYINNSLVATITTHMPRVGHLIRLVFGAKCTTAAGSGWTGYVGHVNAAASLE